MIPDRRGPLGCAAVVVLAVLIWSAAIHAACRCWS
jgi:hypothetical protein